MAMNVFSCYLYLLSALATVNIALPAPCIQDTAVRPLPIPENPSNCTSNHTLTTPAAPFPELYALPGIDVTAFIHVKHVWDPLTVAQIGTFHMVTRNLQLTIRNTMRYHGDQKLPVKGFARKGGGLEYRIHPVPSRRYEVRCSGAQAATRAVSFLLRRYGYFEVEVSIHMFEYVEDRPDAYVVLIKDEDPPWANVLRIKKLKQDETRPMQKVTSTTKPSAAVERS
ncbi:MAG: hypothetical protein LQ339_006388 [Xanthoria mediterranea]|nr:MAG: hypothetical protein LQ339_006388 [Xanthoria mediterranea]